MCSLKANEQRRAELFAKQGRGQQFNSVKERDTWIKKVRRCRTGGDGGDVEQGDVEWGEGDVEQEEREGM